jgi:SnoaL-like domain
MDVHPFRNAFQTRDLDAWSDALADDVVAHSPIFTTPFAGRDSVLELYSVLFEALGDFEITDELANGDSRAFFWHADLGRRKIQGVDLVRVDRQGKIAEITVLIRPLVDIAAFGSTVGPPLARKRGAIRGVLVRLISAPLGWMMALVDAIAPRMVQRRSRQRRRGPGPA